MPRPPPSMPGDTTLSALLDRISRCRICRDQPHGRPLPHEPRPVVRADPRARICVSGQAPGTRVHASGVPFQDASGVRLRAWMGIDEPTFYDQARIAIVPMGFCFPGHDAHGGDLAPRRECAPQWRDQVFGELRSVELILLVGAHAQRWHLGTDAAATVTQTVREWRRHGVTTARPVCIPLPHPSWRNNGWVRKNPWFAQELLPHLKSAVRALL